MGSQEQKFRVVITDGEYYGQGFESKHFPRLQTRAIVSKTEAREPDVLAEVLKDADAVVVRRARLSREALESANSLKGIVKWGMGVDNIDIEAATDLGIVVANTPVIAPAVAEAAILLMLAVAKRLTRMVEAARSGTALSSEVRGSELWSKTLGIVGFGRIGQHVAGMASGFRMRVLYYDPFIPPEAVAGLGAQAADLESLLRQSDFISINCNLTPETFHLIGEKKLSRIQPHAILVNTARGAIVDEAALIAALKEGRIAGAGLDVVEDDPVKAGNPLLSLPNVVVTPHTLARTWESLSRVTVAIEEAALAILRAEAPEYLLNREVLTAERCRLAFDASEGKA